jgi:hypothetical protein
MLASVEVPFDLRGVVLWYRCLGDIPCDYEPGKEEHGAAIFAGPVTGLELEFGKEGEAVGGSFEGGLGGFETRQSLWMLWSAMVLVYIKPVALRLCGD